MFALRCTVMDCGVNKEVECSIHCEPSGLLHLPHEEEHHGLIHHMSLAPTLPMPCTVLIAQLILILVVTPGIQSLATVLHLVH